MVDIVKIKQIQVAAAKRICSNGMERLGQATFNAACEICPIEAEKLRYTKFNPFYDDNRINDFLTQLQKL